MTICRKCGTSNKDTQKFCTFCHELLIADPVELAKLEAAQQKKQKKAERRLKFKRFRWKYAPLLLIPIGLLDLIDLLLCVDLLFLGVGEFLGEILGNVVSSFLGYTTEIFGNLVYTSQLVTYVVRGLEVLGAAGLLVLACVLSVVMIVYMIKWSKHKNDAVKVTQTKQEKAKAASSSKQAEAQQPMQTVAACTGDFTVSYDVLSEVARRHAEYTMPEPLAQVKCKEMFDALRPYLWEYDDDSIRRLLGAMSCSRLIVCNAGAIDSAGAFDSLAFSLGAKSELYVCDGAGDDMGVDFGSEKGSALKGLSRLLLQRDFLTDQYMHSEFTKSLYAARFAPQNLFPAGVRGIEAFDLAETFSPLCQYFKSPDQPLELFLGRPGSIDHGAVVPEGIAGGCMTLPGNLWIFSILSERSRGAEIDSTISQYCTVLYLRNSQNLFPPEDPEQERAALPSVVAWENAVAAAEQEYSLSDELWKVVDLLEEQIARVDGTRFSNRTLRAFERYTSVYLASGGKMYDALDNGLAAVIVPAYSSLLRKYTQKDDSESLSAILERAVGKDRVPVTVEALASMGLI